ncbi:hypothetical protein [Pelagibius sp.]|uniref:hypothetical protein n=1 Tax=Pelagibius sp. TaxID=1931238 RepID=UPI003B5089C1
MTDDASPEAAGAGAGGLPSAAPAPPERRRPSIFDLRAVAPLGPEEQRVKEDAMARALVFGAAPVRDARGWALEVDFIEANGEAVEPWKHDREHKRLYRRSQKLAKAAGQLIGQPGDREEWGKRLARQFYREGSDPEGAVRRGLFEAIWRFDHVYDSFTVPRRYGPHYIKTGRIAAVAEEARRKWQAEGLAPADVFWVRNRRNTGLVLVTPNPDPNAPAVPVPEDLPPEAPDQDILSGQGAETVTGQAEIEEAFEPFLPPDDFDIPTEAYDPSGFYRLEEGEDGAVFVFDPEAAAADARRRIDPRSLDDLAEGFLAVLDAGRDPDDPQWQQRARLLAEFLPGTGHAISAREAYLAFEAASTAMQNGDWEEALLKGGESLLNAVGAVPVFGDLLRLGKGAVKLANLLLTFGRRLEVKPQVLAMASAGGSGGRSSGGGPGSVLGSGSGGAGKSRDGPKERFTLPLSEMTVIKPARDKARLQKFDAVGTQLYVGKGEVVATRVWERGVPLGFRSADHMRTFATITFNRIRGVAPDVRIALRGSAVTGRSFHTVRKDYTGPYFDAKPSEASDFDLALVSPTLMQKARELGIPLRSNGKRTAELTSKDLQDLGLGGLDDDLKDKVDKRIVTFMIYDSNRTLLSRGTVMMLR